MASDQNTSQLATTIGKTKDTIQKSDDHKHLLAPSHQKRLVVMPTSANTNSKPSQAHVNLSADAKTMDRINNKQLNSNSPSLLSSPTSPLSSPASSSSLNGVRPKHFQSMKSISTRE